MTEQPLDINTQGSDGDTGGEAPWASYLSELPESVRPLVEPQFKAWDSNVTQRFQQVHSQYEPLKPYQQFTDAGWSPEDLTQALQLRAALETDPQAVYQALVDNYGYGTPTGEQGQADEPDGTTEYNDPRLTQLEAQQQQMLEFLQQQETTKQQVLEDQQLDTYLNNLKQTFGEFDMDYVMTKMYNGMSGDDAVAQYRALASQAGQQYQQTPVIMGGGGGVPSQQVNPGSMSDKDRKALITQMLAQANQQ